MKEDEAIEIIKEHTNSSIEDIFQFTMKNVKYKRDVENHWQDPIETLMKGTGDCEDYAILNYCLLRLSGFLSVRLAALPGHMVCVVKYKNKWYRLDNLLTDVQEIDLEKQNFIYTLNESGLYTDHLQSNIVKQWDKVLTRMADIDSMFMPDMEGG